MLEQGVHSIFSRKFQDIFKTCPGQNLKIPGQNTENFLLNAISRTTNREEKQNDKLAYWIIVAFIFGIDTMTEKWLTIQINHKRTSFEE